MGSRSGRLHRCVCCGVACVCGGVQKQSMSMRATTRESDGPLIVEQVSCHSVAAPSQLGAKARVLEGAKKPPKRDR